MALAVRFLHDCKTTFILIINEGGDLLGLTPANVYIQQIEQS